MALKLKKEVKKSSYYVWFLGAKESKGLRGLEYILPVIDNLEEREKDIEPFKVTLQVSSKGLKIVQNIVSAQSNKKPKNETIKHFIPHNTITCVHQREDVIACILLLFNPVTKCPLHVHAYRCDSLETATMLKAQLQMLIERPENQKKFAEIESRLMPSTGMGLEDRERKDKGKKDRLDSSIGSSDTGTSTKSESSEERFSSDVRVATLYDSVAAELRAKLNKNDVPILLPPRDYDTVHRQKGNLTGIELRRCLNVNIVGQNGKAKRMASSGGSSGIGSDHAPSPESPDVQERYHDGHSTSDEDWNADQDTGLYLIDQPTYPSPLPKYDYRAEQRKPRQFDQKVTRQHLEEHIRKKLEQRNKYHGQDSFNYKEDSAPIRNPGRNDYRNERNDRNVTNAEYDDYKDYKDYKDYNKEYPDYKDYKDYKDYNREYPRDAPRDRDYPERYYEVEDTLKRQGRVKDERPYRPERMSKHANSERKFERPEQERERRREREPSPEPFQDNFSVLQFSPRERFNDAKEKFLLLEKKTGQEYYPREAPISPNISKDKRSSRYYEEEPVPAPRTLQGHSRSGKDAPTPLERYRASQQKVDKYDVKRRSMFNLSTPNEHRDKESEKEKERDREFYYPERFSDGRDARTLSKDYKRRSYMEQGYRERDQDDFEELAPRSKDNMRDGRDIRHYRDKEAKEFKEQARDWEKDNREYQVRELRAERRDAERCPDRAERPDFRDGREGVREMRDVMMREKKFTPNQRYRNSYAEPSMHQEARKYPGNPGRTRYDLLHRTNSTVSNNGRVGIASVHPY